MLNIKLLKLRIIKSGILTLLPLSIFIVVISASIYIRAGQHLTPYSVKVRGYYRSDGTYVRPHTRRPPGGANHDAPYESKRSSSVIFILIGSGVLCYSIYSFAKLNKKELLWIIKTDIINDTKNTFNSKLPYMKSRNSFKYYYMDNYDEYLKEEKIFINNILLEYKNKTNLVFDDINYLKRYFQDYICSKI
jgi:hypothetical protein